MKEVRLIAISEGVVFGSNDGKVWHPAKGPTLDPFEDITSKPAGWGAVYSDSSSSVFYDPDTHTTIAIRVTT